MNMKIMRLMLLPGTGRPGVHMFLQQQHAWRERACRGGIEKKNHLLRRRRMMATRRSVAERLGFCRGWCLSDLGAPFLACGDVAVWALMVMELVVGVGAGEMVYMGGDLVW
jgi:hypothetical protein